MARQRKKDIEYFLSLEGTVLLNIAPHLLDEQEGAIINCCSDGRCFHDIFNHHGHIQQTCRENPLIHPLPRHGGALVLAPGSPLARRGSTIQDDLYREMSEAMAWLKIRKIVASAHYPCKKASSCHLDAKQVLELLFRAKKEMKRRLARRRPVISSYFHVDYGPDFSKFGKRKQVLSYYASREGWEKLKDA